ncbi:hypothetical protein L6452_13838 [Arctium lappa]|uniref:Uncharacterized protein n=1 Tax=Arctium lappa TaxID=4217 RepID=A0ACB9CJE7_ARCLA|nr:hypothetical protein L6452_13838 [Arctium lappa]
MFVKLKAKEREKDRIISNYAKHFPVLLSPSPNVATVRRRVTAAQLLLVLLLRRAFRYPYRHFHQLLDLSVSSILYFAISLQSHLVHANQ